MKAVAFAPVGRDAQRSAVFATGGGDKFVRLWDAATLHETAVLKGHGQTVRAAAFSPDGRTLATGAGETERPVAAGELKLWDVAAGKAVADLAGHADLVRSVAFSPDGRTLASGSDDRTVRLWDAATVNTNSHWASSPTRSAASRTRPTGPRWPSPAAESGTRTSPAKCGCGTSPRPRTGGPPRPPGRRADGRLRAGRPVDRHRGIDGSVRLWDPETGQERETLEGHQGLVRTLAFAPDGQLLATADSAGVVRLWFAPRRP